MYDIINSDRVIRKNLLQKLKTAARISKTEYFWLSDPSCDINLAWEPDPEVKDYNHIFGSDLNHIEAIFTNKSQIKNIKWNKIDKTNQMVRKRSRICRYFCQSLQSCGKRHH